MSSRSDPRLAVFGLMLLATTIGFAPVVAHLVGIWTGTSTYAYAAAALPLALWMLWDRRNDLAALPTGTSRWPGLAAFSAACALGYVGWTSDVAGLAHLALVLAFVAAFATVYGPDGAWRFAAPLGALFFAIPAGDALHVPMQLAGAAVAGVALNLVGVATTVDGTILTTPVGPYEVAEACSGVAMAATAALAGYAVGFLGFADRRAPFVWAAIGGVLGVVANWIRIVAIVGGANLLEDGPARMGAHGPLGAVAFIGAALTLVTLARIAAQATARAAP